MSLDDKTKELIAIGTSVGVNCQPCLQYHLEKAYEIGLTETDIQEAIRMGQTVKKGAANKMNQYIKEVCDERSSKIATTKGCCGCDG